MSDHLGPPIETFEEPELRAPVLIAAFKGWNDAGEAASFTARHLARVWDATKVAAIDPEEFYDFQDVRPEISLTEDGVREITWPSNEFWAAKLKGHSRDVILLQGTEPSHRWRTFADLIVKVAKHYNVAMVITVGALLADVPHSRPIHITGTADDDELIDRLRLQRSRYEGPTGMVGVLQDAFRRAGIDSASIWAALPHYLTVSPNPKAALALVERIVQLLHIPADIGTLQHATEAYEKRVAEVVAGDEDVQTYVALLEERADEISEELVDARDLPSADEIAEELERFLRDHDK